MFAMPQYEFRFHDNAEWEEISEIELMHRLLESYDRIAHAIQKMIEGEQVQTTDAVYRLKNGKKTKFLG
jgi:uncharacterized protein YdcH (DUF465 family)